MVVNNERFKKKKRKWKEKKEKMAAASKTRIFVFSIMIMIWSGRIAKNKALLYIVLSKSKFSCMDVRQRKKIKESRGGSS